MSTNNWNYMTEVMKKYPIHEGFHYVVSLKEDNNVVFNDYLNKSGVLTRYLKEHFNVKKPSLYFCIKYFKENGIHWYEQWFDIIEVKDESVEYKHCPYCNWKTRDIENKSGAFLHHIMQEHGITKETHLKNHPEDKEYLRLVNSTLNRLTETDTDKFVTCKICGKKLARIDWRHLNSHNITKEEYVFKYGDETVSKELHDKLAVNIKQLNTNHVFTKQSSGEKNLTEYLKELGLDVITGSKKLLGGKELDIYIPSHKIAIEYDGVHYHSEFGPNKLSHTYHLEKTRECLKHGVKLIHIFEDEYVYKQDIVLNKLSHILKTQQSLPKIMGRKCQVKEINKEISQPFLDEYHIQGGIKSTIYLGAYYNNELIAVMLFKKESNKTNNWELTRFASNYNYICQGIGGKLFKYFIRNYNPDLIKSFADRRWTIDEHNNIYNQLGFEFAGYTNPSYSYINASIDKCKRFHKFGFRKQRLHKKYGLPLTMTETEMIRSLGYDRIWDCGLIKYVWKK